MNERERGKQSVLGEKQFYVLSSCCVDIIQNTRAALNGKIWKCDTCHLRKSKVGKKKTNCKCEQKSRDWKNVIPIDFWNEYPASIPDIQFVTVLSYSEKFNNSPQNANSSTIKSSK